MECLLTGSDIKRVGVHPVAQVDAAGDRLSKAERARIGIAIDQVNLVIANAVQAVLVNTTIPQGGVTMEVQWQLPDGAPRPSSAQITDRLDQGIICLREAPDFEEILTPSGHGTTICKNIL